MGNSPKVSICVPVYNNAPYLAAFLDSALRQSFDDYEIVLADNCSTDDSLQILREYERAFPEKVFVHQVEVNRGAASGRNLAFAKSRGAYIFHCDSDDLIHPQALEMLYREAVQYDADIVCGSGYEVYMYDGEITEVREFKRKTSRAVDNNEMIGLGGTHFWLRLLKRDLLEQIGPMPEDCIYEDTRYLTVAHSCAKTIRFLDFPVYYWYRRETSTTATIRKALVEDSIEANKYMNLHVKSEHLKAAQLFAAIRSRGDLDWYWQYYDIFANYLRESEDWIYDNAEIRKNRYIIDGLHWADLRAADNFPNTIYVNGFVKEPSAERIEELREKVFHEGAAVVVLSEKNCDVSENSYIKEAWAQGKTDLVCGYFALKKIYEDGGIFLHGGIRILNPFGFLKYQNAFFALLDKTTYSDWIFGAPSKNEAIAALLETYSGNWDKHKTYLSLKERLGIVLSGKYGLPLDGKWKQIDKIVSVLPPERAVVDTRYGDLFRRCAFEHDFSAFAQDAGYITLPRSSLKAILDNQPPERAAALEGRIRDLEREKEELENTNTWKLMLKIRALGDSPVGKLLKKPFHGLIKLYKKLKGK